MAGHLLSSFFLAVSSNVDNFAVGVAYGVKKIKIGIFSNLVIAVVSASGTYCSMTVGEIISRFLSAHVANLLGSGVLVALGIWSLWDTLRIERREKRNRSKKFSDFSDNDLSYNTFIEKPEKADLDDSRTIDVKESITLAFAVTINNVASGIGGGISGLNVTLTTFLAFILSILVVILGYFLGEKSSAKMSGKWAGIISACLIICIGIYEYLT